MKRTFFICSLFLLQAAVAISQEIPKRVYQAQRLQTRPPRIDGKLNDACWQGDGWAGDFIQQQPYEGKPASQPTEFKILYDNTNLYVAIRAYDREPEKIDVRFSRHDDWFGDVVGICFDSYYDHRTGYEFDLKAGGSKIDLIQMDSGANWSVDLSWDAVWDGKTAIEDSAWTAEMRIPFSQLRFAKKDEQVWGLHVWRWLQRKGEESQFQLIPLDSQGRVHRFGILKGIRDISNPRRIELLPYWRGSLNRFQPEAANPFTQSGQKWGQGLGLDGRIGLAGNFNLDFTINPDFGQVEADPSVVNLTAFETFYEEKRPFFMEGKQMLDFDLEGNLLFYSRRIGRAPTYELELQPGEYTDVPNHTTILGAAKITGKTPTGWSLGVLNSVTAKESAKIQNARSLRRETVEPFANYTVARLQRDFAQGNHSLGAMFTAIHRQLDSDLLNFLPKASYTGGIDGTMQWGNRTYYINAMGMFSHVRGHREAIARLQRSVAHYFQRPDGKYVKFDSSRTSLTGTGGKIEIGKGGNGRWRFEVTLGWLSPGLELNDLGYMQQANLIGQGTEIAYVVNEPTGILNNYEISFEQSNYWNFNREFLHDVWELFPRMGFKNFWGMHGFIERDQHRLHTHLLRGGPALRLPDVTRIHYHLQSDSRKRLRFEVGLFKSFYNDHVSDEWSLFTSLNLRASNKLDFSFSPDYTVKKDNWQYITTKDVSGTTPRYIVGLIDQKTFDLTIRLNYYLTPDLSIQYYGQPFISTGRYSDLKRITNGKAAKFEDRYLALSKEKIHVNPATQDIDVDENLDGFMDYQIENPDFNVREMRSNLVLRWEYQPGSTFYLVWTHGRSQRLANGSFDFSHDLKDLFDIYPNNVFLVKFNHWFSL
ncbi:MAG: carbohydrate binding family 9 domain-containing protein [candidate division KSB1 bacterium]|nr:carbohydrate binding family 9 domain-containing protein [candidate division KSB1 bacterium]